MEHGVNKHIKKHTYLQFNSLINLEFGKRTKAIAFADDLLIAVRANTV